MSNINNNEHEQLSYLLKKIEWPQPDRGLAYRIESAVRGNDIAFAAPAGFFQFKSPVLASMAVMLALLIGVTSGLSTSGTASADEYSGSHIYGSSSMSMTQLYAGTTGGSHE